MIRSEEKTETGGPQIVEFGPFRVIGMSYKGKNENKEITELWGGPNGFITRVKEVETPETTDFSVGLCRCIPGVTDGSFEYIAGLPAKDDAPIPNGMVEANIAFGTYAVFPVESLDVLGDAWPKAYTWFESHPEWEGYCTPEKCDCENHPSFELYPADFGKDGKLFIYIPIHKKGEE